MHDRPVTPADIQYLINQWPFLQVINTAEGQVSGPRFIQTPFWQIFDYGVAMSTSIGGGRFAEDKGTLTKQVIGMAAALVDAAIKKDWSGIQIIDGTPLMKRALWIEASSRDLGCVGYQPTAKDEPHLSSSLPTAQLA